MSPETGKLSSNIKHRIMPLTRHVRGSDIIFDLPMVPPLGASDNAYAHPGRGSTMGYDYTALRAQNSTHSVRMNRLIDYNFANNLGTHSEYNEAQRNSSLRLGKKH